LFEDPEHLADLPFEGIEARLHLSVRAIVIPGEDLTYQGVDFSPLLVKLGRALLFQVDALEYFVEFKR
jgi:hypothetical protein